jgi:hypothetical protein
VSTPTDNTPATIAAAIATVLDGPRPPWVSASTWNALASALDALRDDALAATAGRPSRAAAEALGCGDGSVRRWREGWLRE